jgi:hypothetical protein
VRRKSVADTKAAQKERLKKETGSSDWTRPPLSAMRFCSHHDDPIVSIDVCYLKLSAFLAWPCCCTSFHHALTYVEMSLDALCCPAFNIWLAFWRLTTH